MVIKVKGDAPWCVSFYFNSVFLFRIVQFPFGLPHFPFGFVKSLACSLFHVLPGVFSRPVNIITRISGGSLYLAACLLCFAAYFPASRVGSPSNLIGRFFCFLLNILSDGKCEGQRGHGQRHQYLFHCC